MKTNVKVMTNKAKYGLAKAITAVETMALGTGMVLTAHADDITVNTDIGDKSMGQIMGGIIGFILQMAQYVGVGLLVFGMYQLYTAMKDENPDGKIKAITFCIVAIGLITLKTALKAVGLIA